jgi:phosphopantetheinyl transferase (holo-ACP synthase)
LLGDDLVDLADAEAAEAALHPRFDARAFAPAERAALAAAADRHALRWTLWAAKEAAYKAARRRDPAVRFHPRAFVVAGDVVTHASGRYRVAVRRAGSALHAISAAEGGRWPFVELLPAGSNSTIDHRPRSGIGRVACGETPGAAARRLAIAAAARLLRCDPRELAIAKAGRVPELLRAGAPTGAGLSLSHHGRFAGFALALGEAA